MLAVPCLGLSAPDADGCFMGCSSLASTKQIEIWCCFPPSSLWWSEACAWFLVCLCAEEQQDSKFCDLQKVGALGNLRKLSCVLQSPHLSSALLPLAIGAAARCVAVCSRPKGFPAHQASWGERGLGAQLSREKRFPCASLALRAGKS